MHNDVPIDPSRVYAVGVGVGVYGFGEDRRETATQAGTFVELLRSRGVPAANITLLTSPRLPEVETKTGVRNSLADFNNVQALLFQELPAHDADLFWLFWAGHGGLDGKLERRLLVANATADYLVNLNLDELCRYYATDRARGLRRQLFTVDACQPFPGKKTAEFPVGIPVPTGGIPGHYARQDVVFASPRGHKAPYVTALGGGVFSAALLADLRGRAATDWPLEVAELLPRLQRRIASLAPEYPEAQYPILVSRGDSDGGSNEYVFFESVSNTTLLPKHRMSLDRILDEVGRPEAATVLDGLWSAVDRLQSLPVDLALQVETVLDVLDTKTCPPNELPPVLAFVEYLSTRLESGELLRGWLDQVASELQIARGLVETERARLARRPATDPLTYITVRAEPQVGRQLRFALSATLYRDGTSLTFRSDAATPCAVDELQSSAEEILTGLGSFVPNVAGEALTFEFLFPWSLLNERVDAWRLGRSETPGQRLGLRGCVVVRSLDRARADGWTIQAWRSRWERLGAGESASPVWLHQESALPAYFEGKPEHIIINEHDAHSLTDLFTIVKDAVCLMLSYPYETSGTSRCDGLRAALGAGLPAAVWCHSDDSTNLKSDLDELHGQGQLRHLPQRVYRARREAVMAGAGHYGHGLTLLWDDPYRIPELTHPLAVPIGDGGDDRGASNG
jgi:vWA-MoxR associated protein C-terminal domain/vWA-MoxR associated protein middle region 0